MSSIPSALFVGSFPIEACEVELEHAGPAGALHTCPAPSTSSGFQESAFGDLAIGTAGQAPRLRPSFIQLYFRIKAPIAFYW